MGILAHDEWKMGDDDWAALRVQRAIARIRNQVALGAMSVFACCLPPLPVGSGQSAEISRQLADAVDGQGGLRWRSASNLATRASAPSGRPRAAASERRQPDGTRSSPP